MKIKTLNAYDQENTEAKTDSYPYGRLHCSAKWWIEERKGMGQRVCFQTVNPKNGRINNPKKGTFQAICVLFANPENGHIEHDSVNFYTDTEKLQAFAEKYEMREKETKILKNWIAARKAKEGGNRID